jgi:protein-L-isoaspartate(D-aspartate) O-methyltransferase
LTGALEYQRRVMVRKLREELGIRDERVLAAMAEVPRERFVGDHMKRQAYENFALPIGSEQTISQPWVVARMSELLRVDERHSVLEIGTGSGYQTAILARLARLVYSLERVGSLASQAIARLRELGYDNVKVQSFDGSVGWSDRAPFDRILVTAGAPKAPPPLLDQLTVGGRLVIPEGDRESQRLVVYRKLRQGARREVGEAVSFVPLTGRHGWDRQAGGGSRG